MALFGGKKAFIRPLGLTKDTPQILGRAEFTFDEGAAPAVSFARVEKAAVNLTKRPANGVNLRKGFEAAQKALHTAELPGIRMQVIVLVDGSYSMINDYERPSADQPSPVEKLLVRTLAFALNVDTDGSIPIYVYGDKVRGPINIGLDNFENAGDLLQPDLRSTNMTEAFDKALKVAIKSKQLTLIINITDGAPNSELSMKNSVIRSAGYPIMLKNLAIRPVSFLSDIDDLPSKYEIRKEEDRYGNEHPVKYITKDAYGNDVERLVIDVNPDAVRLLDNVDSKAVDPYRATDEEFVRAIVDEIPDCSEVMARVGTLLNVPGYVPEYGTNP